MATSAHDKSSSRCDLYLRTGPFTVHLHTRLPRLIAEISSLYDDTQLAADSAFSDFHIELDAPPLRRWYRPKIYFSADGDRPFMPLPLDQAVPFFEWGLNWCISARANDFLVIHAAAIEKGGRVAIMPGTPGAGKSTLTAALVNRGWRLLSDELALISPNTGLVLGLARPISLKNESIEVIRAYVPGATISRVTPNTTKGNVALLKAPIESIARVNEAAPPAWIIFPKFLPGHDTVIEHTSKAMAMFEIATNCFNHGVHGKRGFELLADTVDACGCYRFTYTVLDEAVAMFDRLVPPG